jgi:hypothetical protein
LIASKRRVRLGRLQHPRRAQVVENKGAKTTVKMLPDGTVVKDINPFEKKKEEEKPKEGKEA